MSQNGVSSLILLLGTDLPRIKYNGIIALHHLLMYLKDDDHRGVKNLIKEHKGVEAMAALLNHENPTFLRIICDCLRFVAKNDKEAKAIILRRGGTLKLLEFLKTGRYQQVIEISLKLIQGKHFTTDLGSLIDFFDSTYSTVWKFSNFPDTDFT